MSSSILPQRISDFLVPFVTLSYETDTPPHPDSFPTSTYYKTGRLDACLIVTMIAVMAILRDVCRLCILEPFARWKLTEDLKKKNQITRKTNGVGNSNGNGHAAHANGTAHANGAAAAASRKELRQLNRNVVRFAEQGWSVIYYTLQWCFGFYIHRNLPTRMLDPSDVWRNYPHFPLAGPVKFYYLAQNAFYLHQMLIINAEAPRKDHVQMMTHHVITVALMVSSYFGNFTRIGCLIMVLMDWCDIFLPLAKTLRYLSLTTVCDITFAFFLVSWFVTRHVLFLFAINSTYSDGPKYTPFIWDPDHGRYWIKETWIAFCTLLSALQVIQIIWFWMICRVAWRVVSGSNASDVRSDESDGEDDKKDN